MTLYSFESQMAHATFNPSEEKSFSILSKKFQRLFRKNLWFHLFFFGFFTLEICALLFMISSTVHSGYMALVLSGLFFSLFTYLILKYYFQAKTPEEYEELFSYFFKIWQEREKHECLEFSKELDSFFQKIDHAFNDFSDKPIFLRALLSRLNAIFQWKKCLLFKESLAHFGIKLQIIKMRENPLELEHHASLVSSFLKLGKLFKLPQEEILHYHIAQKVLSHREIQKKRIRALKHSLEELKILKSLLPSDPWVHAELAACYHDLGDFQKERETYENLMQLRPEDKEIALRLGILYFQQGHTSSGLEIYRQLKEKDIAKAECLIEYYDALFDESEEES